MSNEHYGKAYSGVVFKDDLVTYDMVQSLLNPFVRKSVFDYAIVVSLIINFVVYYLLSKEGSYVIPVFVASYFFWRISYNLGIGILLYNQSNYNSLTNFCANMKFFNYSDEPNSVLQNFIELNFKIKYGPKYSIKRYPIDFNSWLLFRNFVDLILMQDFINYFILFIACFTANNAYQITDESPLLFYSRWIFGVAFIVLNFIVKVDAHNVIKDFAWYWGDFFYLKINNEELVFDGIFELFPHPMYSIGYIGYYGFALISRSYLVLVVSAIAHICQMLFLHYVEDPHIHKTYGEANDKQILASETVSDIKVAPMVFFSNFSFLRPADYMVVAINIMVFGLSYLLLSSKAIFLLSLLLKTGSSLFTSAILGSQSRTKYFTKLYLKRDLNYVDAFTNWCVYYNLQMLLNINLLICLFLKEFSSLYNVNSFSLQQISSLFQHKLFFFKLFVGSFLLFLNYICEVSIMNTIGLNSWFYGDFWLPDWKNHQLSRSGIYKYLNNPEKILGICGVWGVSVICFDSNYLFVLAMVWSLCKMLFISFVEAPHMAKLYGEQVDHDSGFSKTFKKILPKQFKNRKYSYSRVDSESSTPEIGSPDPSGSPIVFHSPNPFISYSKDKQYQLELLNTEVVPCVTTNTNTSEKNTKLTIPIGTPIKFQYKAPKFHSGLDWIGLYKVVNTFNSKKTTIITSNNHWIAVNPEYYDKRYFGHEAGDKEHEAGDSEVTAVLEFNNDILYWEPGVYEIRYHTSEGHDVAVVSHSFELVYSKVLLPKTYDENSISNFTEALFKLFMDQNYLNFEFLDANGNLRQYKLKSIDDDYTELIVKYVNEYAMAILNSKELKTNLKLKGLNSYNVEEYKKKKINDILLRSSKVIKNSIQHPADNGVSSIDVEFSKEILIQDRCLRKLFDRIIKVQKILDEIAN